MQSQSIYHYTSREGLESILKNQILWMTKHHYLNDSKEFEDGLHRVETVVLEYLEKNKKIISNHNYKKINLTMRWLKNTSIFVTSFCKDGDLLSLWERYGEYAIEFDFNRQKMINRDEGTFCNLVHCIYDSTEKDRMSKIIVEGYLHDFLKYPKCDPSDLYNLFIGYLDYIIKAKNEHFYEEKEVRYVVKAHKNNTNTVVLADGEVCNSFGRPILTSGPLYAHKKLEVLSRKSIDQNEDIIYIEKKFPKEFIKSVCIHPKLNFEKIKTELEKFLNVYNYDIEIKQSKIPLK